MGGKLLLILVRKPERKRLLGWLRFKHEDSIKIDLSCGMAVWVRFTLPKTKCTEHSINLRVP